MSAAAAAADAEGYRLLDSGGGRRLEQVGPYRLDRQAAGAWWRPRLPAEAWAAADAIHHRSDAGGGEWELRRPLPESWAIEHGGVRMRVKLTPFGHLGLFAEHVAQWAWMQGRLREAGGSPRVLNLFAYTGGASVAAAQAGARVSHVDAAKGIVDWARENAQRNGVDTVQWVVEDAALFVQREHKRGRQYEGIILDPPTFGRGAKRELWKIEEQLPPLLAELSRILSPDAAFFLLSCHTPGFTPLALRNLLGDALGGRSGRIEEGEMFIPEAEGRALPSGAWSRWSPR